MEKPTWHKRPTFDRSTVHRAPVATWAPIRTESFSRIIIDQTPNAVRKEMEQELWSTRGDRQTMGGFIAEIRTQEGLTEPK